jgi:hypothetical protein
MKVSKSVRSGWALGMTLLVAALTGCGPGVQGSGNVVDEARQVAEFTSIDVSDGITANVMVGFDQGVHVSGDDNLVALVKTEVRSGRLQVFLPESVRGWSSENELRVDVAVPRLESLTRSGGSTVKAQHIDADTFTLEASGGGLVELTGRATSVTTELSGGTRLEARDFAATDATLHSSGGGSTVMKVSTTLSVEASGGGDVRIMGRPSVRTQDLSGGSTLKFE